MFIYSPSVLDVRRIHPYSQRCNSLTKSELNNINDVPDLELRTEDVELRPEVYIGSYTDISAYWKDEFLEC